MLRWALADRLLGRRKPRLPGPAAPRVAVDPSLIRHAGSLPRATWIGHSSFLCMLGGARFLVDPVFSSRIGLFYPRHVAPGLLPDGLPPLDAVLVSHNHYDHLDLASLRSLAGRAPLVVPRGLRRWLAARGFDRVVELGWWESTVVGPLTITFVPSRHWSRRGLWDTNQTLWGGFVVEAQGQSIYHAGDSAWFDGFHEIGRRFPRLLAALLPIGGYQPAWFMENNHLNPQQAGEAFLAVGARSLIPMHWGTFQMTDEPLAEPAERLQDWWQSQPPGHGRRLHVPAVGQTVVLDG